VEVVAGEVIQAHLRNQNYAAARGVLDLWQSNFRDIARPAAQAWQDRFQAAAERQVADARRLSDEKQYLEARRAAQRAVAIWPKHVGAAEMLARIQREFPFVSVGVFESAPERPYPRIDSWPALRASRLAARQLVEQVGFGAEGGEYRSSFGELALDESGLVLRWKLSESASPLSANELARYLLSMAKPGNPQFRAELADVLAGVSIAAGNVIEIHLKRPHVRPEALLQVPPPAPSAGTAATGRPDAAAPFAVNSYLPTEVVYAARKATGAGSPARAGQLHAIVEQLMPDDDAAVAALVAGDIDVLDHLPPWQASKLRGAAGIRVGAYRLPTVHALILHPKCELAARREFRRALCYGVDRAWTVERVLLGGKTQPGFEVVSGPFPAGTSLSDPLRYGYNNQIAPRPFEPRLATILASVAWTGIRKAKAEKSEEKSPAAAEEIPQLVLAHSSDPLSRTACQLIQTQLKREGVPIELRQYTAGDLLVGRVEYDLRYAELAVWEPLVDARRMLAAGGLAGEAASPQVLTALSQLDEATNWKDVRARMADLHQIAHRDLLVIPLWQTINYFAYRDTVAGIGEAPMTLYQNVDDWRMAPSRSVAANNN
jgi:ABC-type transport system substrate-binding protein